MTFDDVKKHFGSVAKAAKALKMTQAAVYAWKYRGRIPRLSQAHVQIASNGVLKMDAEEETPPATA